MFSLAAYSESLTPGGALHFIAGVVDPHLTVFGDEIRVPQFAPNLMAMAVLSAATTLTSARLEAPSFLTRVYPDIEPLVNALKFGDPPQVICDPKRITVLEVDEDLRLAINSADAGVVREYGLVWFCDGPPQPVQGEVFTIRARTSIALSAGEWVNGPIIFEQTLPVGRYNVVGMRARGANLVAARLVPIGAHHRPGVPAVPDLGFRDQQAFRHGNLGVFCQFDSTTPPTVDALGETDTAQEYILDLQRVS